MLDTMTAMRSHIKLDARAEFDGLEGVVYLNTCGMAPRLRCVSHAAADALSRSARPWEAEPDAWIEQTESLRVTAADWIGAQADSLAFTPSVSYAMAVAARNCPVGAGQNVLVLHGEYPSNRMAWQSCAEQVGAQLRPVQRSPDQDWTQAVLQQIDDRTAVVSIPPAHWADGGLIDLIKVGARCREVGAALVIDASQWWGAVPFDFERVQADFVMAPGHKWLLGAYGLGWLWAAPKYHSQGQPIEHSILARDEFGDFASLGDRVPPFRSGARRFDFGPYPHPLSVPMSMAALQWLGRWTCDQVQAELAAAVATLRQAFAQRGLAEGFDQGACAPHYCVWSAPDQAAQAAVRDALGREKIIVAWRAGRLRLSPHLHLDAEQLVRVADVVAAAV